MPIYEYRCKDCNTCFEKIISSSAAAEKITCAKCKSQNVKKTISAASYRLAGSKSSAAPAGCMSGCSSKPGFS